QKGSKVLMANRHNYNSLSLLPPHLICMCKNVDVKPKGSDGGTSIDIRIIEVSLPDTALADLDRSLSYYELFTVIEAKCSMSEEDKVFK
ncbi:hypothetical protein EV182_001010, partial [Spiromyces aspiralis]